MIPGYCTTCRSPHINTSVDLTGELNELVGVQGPAKSSNVSSDEAPTLPETPTPPLVLLLTKDLFTKFMKVFMETTQTQALAKP